MKRLLSWEDICKPVEKPVRLISQLCIPNSVGQKQTENKRCVSVSCGCCNKRLKTEWLNRTEQYWGLEVQQQRDARAPLWQLRNTSLPRRFWLPALACHPRLVGAPLLSCHHPLPGSLYPAFLLSFVQNSFYNFNLNIFVKTLFLIKVSF